MMLGNKEPVKYLDYWRCRRDEQLVKNQRLAQQARTALPQIVDVLGQEFSAKKIILFGSLVKGSFAEGSDIDLAVEGIPHEEYFTALAAANRQTKFWVDLKPIEDLEPYFRDRVLTTGEVIYETSDCQQAARIG